MSNPGEVFISYAHPDGQHAHAIAAFLRASDFQVWIDADRVRPADNIAEMIGAGAKAASVCVALLSETYVKSSWCDKELALFKMRGTRIIGYMAERDAPVPLVLADCLCARSASELPGAIRNLPKTELREETLSRAGVHTAFRIPYENWRRNERTRLLIEEELQTGGTPQISLLGNSGFKEYCVNNATIKTKRKASRSG